MIFQPILYFIREVRSALVMLPSPVLIARATVLEVNVILFVHVWIGGWPSLSLENSMAIV
jgi:hypothetical protein